MNEKPSITMVAKNNLRNVAMGYQQMRGTYSMLIQRLWKNNHYTPQEILAELGDKAADIVEYQEKLKCFLNDCVPDSTTDIDSEIPLYTKNSDGTVTINEE